jgi:hypothetical protein
MKALFRTNALVAVLFLAGCADVHWGNKPTIKGSGEIVSESREVSGFDRVSVSGSGKLQVIQGDTESLTIETDDNLLAYIKSEVSGSHLKIGPDDVNLRPTRTIQYQLRLKDLRQLRLSGSLDAESESLETGQLELSISGSGSIEIRSLSAEELSLHISGSGRCEVAGKAPQLDVHISGSGDCLAGGLASETGEVHISGSGNAVLWVNNSLDAHVSGSGRVDYYGRPTVNHRVSGSGRVQSLGAK